MLPDSLAGHLELSHERHDLQRFKLTSSIDACLATAAVVRLHSA